MKSGGGWEGGGWGELHTPFRKKEIGHLKEIINIQVYS